MLAENDPMYPHAPMDSTLKIAYEPLAYGFAVGIVFADGDPWICVCDARSVDHLKTILAETFWGRTICYISIDEYNRLKGVYARQRARTYRHP